MCCAEPSALPNRPSGRVFPPGNVGHANRSNNSCAFSLVLFKTKGEVGFFALRTAQRWFVSWQLTFGRERVGGEVRHTQFSHLKLILVVAFLVTADERNNTMTGKSSFKERESFNGRNILKVSMKQLGKWSQLWILHSQKRLKHLIKAAFVSGLQDLLEGGKICLENKQSRSLVIGSITAFSRVFLKLVRLRSGVCSTNVKWVFMLSFTSLVFYPGDSGSCGFAAHQKGVLCCSCSTHSYIFMKLNQLPFHLLFSCFFLISAVDLHGFAPEK